MALSVIFLGFTACSPSNKLGTQYNPDTPLGISSLVFQVSRMNSPGSYTLLDSGTGTWTPSNNTPIGIQLPANSHLQLNVLAVATLSNNVQGTASLGAKVFGPTTSYVDVVSWNPENFLVTASQNPKGFLNSLTYNDSDGKVLYFLGLPFRDPSNIESPFERPVGRYMTFDTGTAGSGTITLTMLRRPKKVDWGATNVVLTEINQSQTGKYESPNRQGYSPVIGLPTNLTVTFGSTTTTAVIDATIPIAIQVK